MEKWFERGVRNTCKKKSIFIHVCKIWQDNSSYEGEWLNDYMQGKGKMVHADGDIYEGEWVMDMA